VDIQIKNNAKHLLLVPLSSRATLHLGPGEVSAPVSDSEVNQNPKVTKLASSGLISILRQASQQLSK